MLVRRGFLGSLFGAIGGLFVSGVPVKAETTSIAIPRKNNNKSLGMNVCEKCGEGIPTPWTDHQCITHIRLTREYILIDGNATCRTTQIAHRGNKTETVVRNYEYKGCICNVTLDDGSKFPMIVTDYRV